MTWEKARISDADGISLLAEKLFGPRDIFSSAFDIDGDWSNLVIIESASESQYDTLNDLAGNGVSLPHALLCIAGRGSRFHGFKGRRWDSPEGNLYLSAFFAPHRKIENYGVGFMVLAAVSVIESIDMVPGLKSRPTVKWVNDILIDGAKVCGVLAHTIAEGDRVTGAVIGVGLNVEITPEIEPTVFVPRAGSLREFTEDARSCRRGDLFRLLTKSIYKNYLILLEEGFPGLLKSYRDRSNVIGREVVIYDDEPGDKLSVVTEGLVTGIGDDLELLLADHDKPVRRGRLAFK